MTVRFKKDWNRRVNGAKPSLHLETKNKSFLRTCQVLKRMGIQNHLFPLCLYDADLINVDPHNLEEDTPENKLLREKVMIEARINGWYYLRECVRIESAGGDPIPFKLDRGSVAMAWCFFTGVDYTGMQPRQTGKSICALALTSWILYISGYRTQIGMLTKDNTLREENVRRVKSMGDNLPGWWIAKDKNNDKYNTGEIYYEALKTKYTTYVAQENKAAANKIARGSSPPFFHFDELEFIKNIGISFQSVLAATGTAREYAKLNNQPHSIIITTTAGDPKEESCQESIKILSDSMPFTERLFDIENNEKLDAIIRTVSPQGMIIGVFSHLQLGYSNEEIREKIIRNKMSRDQALRDYFNRRMSVEEKPVIPANILAEINSSQIDSKYLQIISDRFAVYWYVDEETVHSEAFKQIPIVVGCDSSEMIDRDATTLVGIDPRDLSVVFTFRCAEGNIRLIGTMIAQLLLMFPKMIFVPENKSSGTAIIDSVILLLSNAGQNPFTRIFNWVVNNQDLEEFRKYNIKDLSLLDTAIRRYFGIKTDKSKRDQLFTTTLLSAASKSSKKIRDKTLITELNSLTVRNGRVDHAIGGHDDTVIAWLLAMWFIFNAKHLSTYGLKPGFAMSQIIPNQLEKSRLSAEHQTEVRKKIDELEEKLKRQTDPMLRRIIESDLNFCQTLVGTTTITEPLTADDLLVDPKRYTDSKTVRDSKPVISNNEIEKTLKMLLNV